MARHARIGTGKRGWRKPRRTGPQGRIREPQIEIGPNVEDEAGLVVVWPLMEKRGKCRGKISGLEKLDNLWVRF